MRVVITGAAGASPSADGVAVRVAPKPESASRYEIEVAVQQEMRRPIRIDSTLNMEALRPEALQLQALEQASAAPAAGSSGDGEDDVSQVLDELLAALILPPEADAPRKRGTHLSGELSRIRLPTLFSLFEMERLTGTLVVHGAGRETRVYVSGGHIIDLEPLAQSETPRSRIGQLMAASTGAFDFVVEAVERPDRLNLTTTALLLDVARETDEARGR